MRNEIDRELAQEWISAFQSMLTTPSVYDPTSLRNVSMNDKGFHSFAVNMCVCVCVCVCVSSKMMDLCGEAEDKLAYDQSQHEVQIQRDLLDPLNQLAEVSPDAKKSFCITTWTQL